MSAYCIHDEAAGYFANSVGADDMGDAEPMDENGKRSSRVGGLRWPAGWSGKKAAVPIIGKEEPRLPTLRVCLPMRLPRGSHAGAYDVHTRCH